MTTWGMRSLGRIVLSEGVADWASAGSGRVAWLLRCIDRHAAGDWGAASAAKKQRVSSAYEVPKNLDAMESRVLCVTEADRSLTRLAWPDESVGQIETVLRLDIR